MNKQRHMGKVKTLVAPLAAAGMAAVLAGCADANSEDGGAPRTAGLGRNRHRKAGA
ncbi:hypothetical protein MasN3_46120 [Massilia varians]|uniref:Lipoprotein n=1 Tax=Massilia varians TaxID=457921 RepID=A0ABN6TI51_9BURK|nr:hypothetical protein MasN3_46120 [Massilia varians]